MKTLFLTSLLISTLCFSQSSKHNDLILKLSIAKHKSESYLIIEVQNNSNQPQYYTSTFKKTFFDELGKDISDDFWDWESERYYSIYGWKPREIESDYIASQGSLYRKPFSKRKEMIRKAAWLEMVKILEQYDFIEYYDLKLSTVETTILFAKYPLAIFIEPNSSYRDSISITTLCNSDKNYEIIVESYPFHWERNLYFPYNLGKDSIAVSGKPLPAIDDYILYEKPLRATIKTK
jgi:hypothetical protein